MCILIDNAVDYTKRVEVERVAWHATILDLLVLVIEVVEESWSVVSTVRLREKVEVLGGTDLRIKLRNGVQEGLQYVLHRLCVSFARTLTPNFTYEGRHGRKIGRVDCALVERLEEWISSSCWPFSRVVMEILRPGIEAANALLLVAETSAYGLGDVQHVGN